jgi:predicted  nucleic acid-binding Zn-ribbon protein
MPVLKVYLCDNCGSVEMMTSTVIRPRFAGCLRCGWRTIRDEGTDRPSMRYIGVLEPVGEPRRPLLENNGPEPEKPVRVRKQPVKA